MPRAYHSMVLDHPADAVWAVIRDFGHYAWAGVEGGTVVEDGKAGDQVGAVRRVAIAGGTIRQVLLAHSDLERRYAYRFCEPSPHAVEDYTATIRVTPVTADGRAFVEWWATFDCAPDARERWLDRFERQGFAVWLAALRRFMDAAR